MRPSTTEILNTHTQKDGITDNKADRNYLYIHNILRNAQIANGLPDDIYTITLRKDATVNNRTNMAFFGVTSGDKPYYRHSYTPPKEIFELYNEGGIIQKYKTERGTWISAFAPIVSPEGITVGVVETDVLVDQLLEEAEADFLAELTNIIIISVILIIVVLGLTIIITKIISRTQNAILHFSEITDMLETLTTFASEIGNNQFDNDLEHVEEIDNKLSNALLLMRNKIVENKSREETQNWTMTGIADFIQIMREHDSSLLELCNTVISRLVDYLNAHQGVVYIMQMHDDVPYLELTGTYAFSDDVHGQKVEYGEGLIGQVWRNKEPMILNSVPEDFARIQSGLGSAVPTNIIVTPLIYNNDVFGVLEISSMNAITKHECDFVDSIGASLASVVSSVKVQENTSRLLEDSKIINAKMARQDEEMRRNSEELFKSQAELMERIQQLEAELQAKEAGESNDSDSDADAEENTDESE